mgnify:CR=1 FL=1
MLELNLVMTSINFPRLKGVISEIQERIWSEKGK